MATAAIVLAAGASSRMGSPKALLVHNGQRFVDRLVDLARAAGAAPVVVVSGAVPLPDLSGVQQVHNARWRCGRLSSIRVGLRALEPLEPLEVNAVALLTVDRPHLRLATLRTLLGRAQETADWDSLQPTLGDRHGHPIVLHRRMWPEILSGPDTGNLRDRVRRSRRRFIDIDDDPAILDNIDSPEDLARLPRNW